MEMNGVIPLLEDGGAEGVETHLLNAIQALDQWSDHPDQSGRI